VLGSVRSALMVSIFILLTVGPLGAACPEGDLRGDCHIDWFDVEILAGQWLNGAGSEADLIGGDGVNMRDFARLAANWGVTGQPAGSLQVIISPQAAIGLGAKWRIDGGDWRESGELVPDLPVGPHTIEFSEIDTWAEPAEQVGAVAEDLITDIRASYKHPLVINEFMASNSMFYLDPQGQDDDWIEIYNSGEAAIDIGGLHLTDNLADPTRWRVPDGLHAAFELSAAGNDEIGLFDSNGTSLIDSIAFPDQDPNVSYGRFPDGNDTWQFFPQATPRSENVGAYLGDVADTKFSHNRGFYDTPFSVRIATETEGAVIYYTLNGAEPGKVNGPSYTGTPYTGPIPITRTSCLRARAVKTGWKPSNADAQTYVFLDNVISQPAYPSGFPSYWSGTAADYEMDPAILNDSRYKDLIKPSLLSLPVMSIATDVDNLFDSATGIYANPSNRGVAWEKPASVEFFNAAGEGEFQINCGLRIQGGWFRPLRNCRKKSFRLLFKGMYGSTKLDFPLFGDDGVESFDTITLRAGANDGYSWRDAKYTEQYTRDQFGRSLQSATGHAASRGTFVHLYVNGLYWGLYNPCERPDNSFAASHCGGEKDNWDSIKTGKEVLSGSISAWNQMVAKCQDAAGSDEEFQRLQGNNPDGTPNAAYPHLLDVPNYIDYLIVNLWAGNWDWPWKNYYMARQQGPESTGFKFFCWDCENTVGNNLGRSNLNKNSLNNNFTHVGEPHTYLRQNAEYKMQFADHVHRLLFNGGILTPASLIERYSQMAGQVELSIISESARWGDQHHHPPLTLEDWYDSDGNYNDGRAGRGWILDYYLPHRTGVVLQQFKNAGLYPSIDAPVFRINGSYRHGGHISSADSFSITAGAGTIYYTIDGNDPRVPVTSTGGSSTVLVTEGAEKRVLVPTGTIDNAWKGGAAFTDSGWGDATVISGKTGGVGYDRNTTYKPFITYDVESKMRNLYTGCYFRIPFKVDAGDPGDFDSMTLKVRYDDGFVAYLNGAELERSHVSGEADWDSTAAENSDGAAVVFESFDVTDHIGDLRAGDNILAVHGVNKSTGSSDFLVSVELVAAKNGTPSGSDISSSAMVYSAPRTFDKSACVKARLKSGNTWSALNEATYAVGPVADSLRISEIMYHPLETGDPNA